MAIGVQALEAGLRMHVEVRLTTIITDDPKRKFNTV